MKRSYKSWTAEEDAYLRQHYKTEGGASVADALGRTICSVRERAKCVGAAKRIHIRRKALTDEQRAEFARLFPNTTNKELAEQFGLSAKSISLMARRMNVRKSAEHKKRVFKCNLTDDARAKGREAHAKRIKRCRRLYEMGIEIKYGNLVYDRTVMYRTTNMRSKMRKLGYDVNRLTITITEQTSRNERWEAILTNKGCRIIDGRDGRKPLSGWQYSN